MKTNERTSESVSLYPVCIYRYMLLFFFLFSRVCYTILCSVAVLCSALCSFHFVLDNLTSKIYIRWLVIHYPNTNTNIIILKKKQKQTYMYTIAHISYARWWYRFFIYTICSSISSASSQMFMKLCFHFMKRRHIEIIV